MSVMMSHYKRRKQNKTKGFCCSTLWSRLYRQKIPRSSVTFSQSHAATCSSKMDVRNVCLWFMSLCFQLGLVIIVLVSNENDNPPVFEQNLYHINVNEVRVRWIHLTEQELLFLIVVVCLKTVSCYYFITLTVPFLSQMSPIGTSVGRFTAKDLDQDQIYYTLTSESVRPGVSFYFISQ